jgi:hypothetical protein
MVRRLATVDTDDGEVRPAFKVPESSLPERLSPESLGATYVTFKNFNGTAVTGKHVEITLTADGTDIDNIKVVTP